MAGALVVPVVELSAVGCIACAVGEPLNAGTAGAIVVVASPPTVEILPIGVAELGMPAPLPGVVSPPWIAALSLGVDWANAGAPASKNAAVSAKTDFIISPYGR